LLDPNNENATITDFNGVIGVAHIQGTGSQLNTAITVATAGLLYDADMRFTQGKYVGVDDQLHTGTLGDGPARLRPARRAANGRRRPRRRTLMRAGSTHCFHAPPGGSSPSISSSARHLRFGCRTNATFANLCGSRRWRCIVNRCATLVGRDPDAIEAASRSQPVSRPGVSDITSQM
jgi:hypothetical protein